jgi:FtsZ-interacting cell division protein YlmF
MQAEEDQRRQQMEQQSRRQQAAQQQQRTQAFNRQGPQQPAYQQPQSPQQQSNVLPFPGMIRGPEGNLYAHVEYIVLLRNRNECTKVIEYIKSNASVFLNMEFIANDSERQRCVDMLSGAAYTWAAACARYRSAAFT